MYYCRPTHSLTCIVLVELYELTALQRHCSRPALQCGSAGAPRQGRIHSTDSQSHILPNLHVSALQVVQVGKWRYWKHPIKLNIKPKRGFAFASWRKQTEYRWYRFRNCDSYRDIACKSVKNSHTVIDQSDCRDSPTHSIISIIIYIRYFSGALKTRIFVPLIFIMQ